MRASKFILYKIASIFNGKIKGILKISNSSDVQRKKIKLEKKILNIYFLKNSRLYTDRIHNLGIINNNYLLKEPSYQIINNNYAKIQKNIILKIGTPRILKKLKGTILCLLSGGGANENYFHWLYDVLPRLFITSKFLPIRDINFFLLPSLEKKFQRDSLKIIGIKKKKLLDSKIYRHITSDKIIVTDHPYIKRISLKDQLKIPYWICEWLKEIFLSKLKKIKKKYPKKIFLLRKNIKNNNYLSSRILIKEKQIKNFLKQKKFEFINPEKYSFKEQLRLFNNAKTIVGVHGAAFANIVFCKKNTNIVELQSKTTGDVIKNLALKNNLRYFRMISKSNLSKDQNGIIDINLNYFMKFIKKIT